MPVIFKEKEHLYLHEGKKLESVTTLLKKLSSTDWDLVKERYAKKHKMTVDEVTNKWNKSAEVGTLIHAKFEKEIYDSGEKSFIHESVEEGKLAFDLKSLEAGNYPELIIYSNYYKIAGQSDLVVIHDDKTFEIEDYKGLALDTEIPTKVGFKLMKDIEVGDEIFDGDGNITKVKHVSSIHKNPCYKITFDTKEEIVCDHEHKWEISERNYKGEFKEIVKNTLELKNLLESKHQLKSKLRIKCVSLNSNNIELPLDPYVLGCWLGDGGTHYSRITNMNPKMWREIEKRGYSLGGDVSNGKSGKAQERTILGIRHILKDLNLTNNKHIPDIYLRSSYNQRLDLLRGLMDTDGCLHRVRNRCVMNTTNIKQAEMLLELCSSLGLKPNIIKYNGTGFGKTFKGFSINFKAGKDNPFLCKNSEYKNNNKNILSDFRYIKNIEKIETVETKCISVESENHTYLVTRSYIKTHNTDKEITFKGSIFFNSKKRVAEVQKFKNPVSHLDDVNWNKYQLQLSIYAYILERQGYKLKFKPDHTGTMKPCLTIKHVVTERCDDGSHYIDETGNPVIQDVILYTCEYLKEEASKILEAYKWSN